MIRSMYADIPNHEPSMTLMNTGANIIGRPSMGSWITYGLGSENANLPGYVVLCPSQPITIGSPLVELRRSCRPCIRAPTSRTSGSKASRSRPPK